MTQEWTLTATFKGELLENKTHAIFRFILVRMKTPNLANDIDFNSLISHSV